MGSPSEDNSVAYVGDSKKGRKDGAPGDTGPTDPNVRTAIIQGQDAQKQAQVDMQANKFDYTDLLLQGLEAGDAQKAKLKYGQNRQSTFGGV